MADEHVHHISIQMKDGFHSAATFEDLPGRPAIQFGEPPPLGSGDAPSAAAVLAAAVGNCLAASLTFCLKRARVDVEKVDAAVTAHVERNERGRLRIERIDVTITPEITGSESSFERCAALFEDFCTVTSSVREGIPVNVTLKHERAADAA